MCKYKDILNNNIWDPTQVSIGYIEEKSKKKLDLFLPRNKNIDRVLQASQAEPNCSKT